MAFVSESQAEVDAFWQAGVDAGYRDDGARGLRPQYGSEYYGGFLLDPDGNSAEAVIDTHRPERGCIDHLWIGVRELAAAEEFYEGLHIAFPAPDRDTVDEFHAA